MRDVAFISKYLPLIIKDEFTYSRVRKFENFLVQFNYFLSSTESNIAELKASGRKGNFSDTLPPLFTSEGHIFR